MGYGRYRSKFNSALLRGNGPVRYVNLPRLQAPKGRRGRDRFEENVMSLIINGILISSKHYVAECRKVPQPTEVVRSGDSAPRNLPSVVTEKSCQAGANHSQKSEQYL